jgi:hypothetical protein
MKRNYPQFFTLIRQFRMDKEEVALASSGGRTASLRSLTDQEWSEIMEQLTAMQKGNKWNPPAGDVQRKKMISIARQMNWHLTPGPSPQGEGRSEIQIIMERLDGWCLKQKFKKELMKHTVQELNVLVSIFEEKVYKSYLEDLNK